MFYVKSKINKFCTITTEITDENVFTNCPGCGVEHGVDIFDLIETTGGDLSGGVYCDQCSQKIRDAGIKNGVPYSPSLLDKIFNRPRTPQN